jgi:hypothetical protein
MSALAHLESLLRARKLDVTLTASAAWRTHVDRAPTGVPSIGAALGGGLPRGPLSEIVGARSAGRTALAWQALGCAAERGEAVALVDPCDRFDPESASAPGGDLSRLLWIRGTGDAACAQTALKADAQTALKADAQTALKADAQTALKAMTLVLQAGNFVIVALDLCDVPAPALRAFPFTTWLRLARMIDGTQTVALVVATEHLARSAGGVTIALDRPADLGHAAWAGASNRARLLSAITLHPRVIAPR